MASEALEKAGLHFDDLNRIRVLDEDTSSQVSGIDHRASPLLQCSCAGISGNLLHSGPGAERGLSGFSGGHWRFPGKFLLYWSTDLLNIL